MKIWLDDQRPAPPGWTWLRTVDSVITHVSRGGVEDVSLDYDLDYSDPGRHGVEVLVWALDELGEGRPVFHNHSANPYGAALMALWINAMEGGPRPTPELLHMALQQG